MVQYSSAGLVLGVVAALAFDAWYESHLYEEARTKVASEMAPAATALRSAVDRRVVLLNGLWSFAEAAPTRARLDADFPSFARGLLMAVDGVRALQFVQEGRIVATWPLVGNERALGYDLLTHPSPLVRDGVRRGMATDSVVVTGPVELVQGGMGLLVRRRLSPRRGFPDFAAIILDVPSIIRDAGLPAPGSSLVYEVRDRSGQWFGGDSAGAAVDPVSLPVAVPDGNWTLLAAPRLGWDALIAAERRASRFGSLGFVLAAVLVGMVFGQRQARLAIEMEGKKAELGVALRAGRMGTWKLDVLADRLEFDETGASILGRTISETTGSLERLFRFLHGEDAAFVAKAFLEVLGSDRSTYTLEHRIVLPDGSTRWVFVTGEVERDQAGKAVRAQGIIADASDRRAMEARSRQLERVETIGTMAGGVAHDFNNLLMAMVACTEMAKEELEALGDVDGAADARGYLDEVLKTATRAQALTRQLLAFSRGSSSDPRRTDLRIALVEMEPLLRRVLGMRIALTVRVEQSIPPVWVDPSQLTQVILNLLVNARDAIHQDGAVDVSLSVLREGDPRPPDAPTGEWVVLAVTDSGVGMPEDVRKRVFEPYFTTKGHGRGTGLGLSVFSGVVRSAGGVVTAESELGRGTTMRVYLPPMDGDRPSTRISGAVPMPAI